MKRTPEQFEQDFLKLYYQGFSVTEICNRLQENRSRGYSYLRRKNIPNHFQTFRKYSQDFLDTIINEYQQGSTIQEIAKRHPEYKEGIINYRLRQLGLTRRNGKRVFCQEDYFEQIDTPQKAYFLGLLYADGNIQYSPKEGNSYHLRLELQWGDKYIIELLKQELKSKNPVLEYKDNNKCVNIVGKPYLSNKHSAYFTLGNNKICQDLIKHGCTNGKDKRLKVPNLSSKLLRYFVLGFFDGDGCASFTDKNHCISFLARKPLLEEILQILEKNTDIKIPNIHYTHSNLWVAQWSAKQDILKFYYYFYENYECQFLLRKYNKIKSFCESIS